MELIASIPKSRNAEIRVVRDTYKGRQTIDVRVWFLPAGGEEFIRSKRGVQFDEKTLPDVLAALQAAAVPRAVP